MSKRITSDSSVKMLKREHMIWILYNVCSKDRQLDYILAGKKTNQSHPPVCMPYKNNSGNQMSPKREERKSSPL